MNFKGILDLAIVELVTVHHLLMLIKIVEIAVSNQLGSPVRYFSPALAKISGSAFLSFQEQRYAKVQCFFAAIRGQLRKLSFAKHAMVQRREHAAISTPLSVRTTLTSFKSSVMRTLSPATKLQS